MTLALEGVEIRYGDRIAVKPTSLELEPGALIGLVGPNGAGKSSLLKAVAGVLPCSGNVSWNAAPLARFAPLERARAIAYLPQSPEAHWSLTVWDLVALGRLPHRGYVERYDAADAAAVGWALQQCDAADFAARSFDQLSGGERARVLLARALAVQAPVLLVDEPIQSLDPYHQLQIMNVLHACACSGTLVIAVLHDVALAARFCQRVILLHQGEVVADGPAEGVLSAGALERYYRVQTYLASYDGSPIIVPWRRLD